MGNVKINKTKVYCFDPKRQRYALMGNKIGETFFKKVKPIHFMRIVNGYGLQYDAFVEFAYHGINKIGIIEESGNTWESISADWIIHGKVADYGHGKQIFLSLKFMHLKNKEKLTQEFEAKEAKRAQKIQEALFR